MTYPSRILIINPFGIGDVLFTTPLIRNLKEAFPKSKIGFLCNRRTEPIIRNHTNIDWTFVYERDEFEDVKKRSKLLWLKKYVRFMNDIREKHFDIAFDLSLSSQFGFLGWYTGIKKRIGYDYKKRGRFLTHKFRMQGYENKHVIDYHLGLLKFIEVRPISHRPNIYINSSDRIWAKHFLYENKVEKDDVLIGIAPGGGESFGEDAYRKLWPIDRFVKLCDRLQRELNAKICIVIGPKEKHICEKFSDNRNVIVVSSVGIMQAAAAIDNLDLVISNDSGLLRVANSLGKKIVAIFGPVDTKVYCPYPPEDNNYVVISKELSCSPCYKKFRLAKCKNDLRCLKDITVEEVFQAAKSLLFKEKVLG